MGAIPVIEQAPAAPHPYVAVCQCAYCNAIKIERLHSGAVVTVYDRLDQPGRVLRLEIMGTVHWLDSDGRDIPATNHAADPSALDEALRVLARRKVS